MSASAITRGRRPQSRESHTVDIPRRPPPHCIHSDDDVDYPFRGPDVMRAIEEDPVDLGIGETDDLSEVREQLGTLYPWSEFRD